MTSSVLLIAFFLFFLKNILVYCLNLNLCQAKISNMQKANAREVRKASRRKKRESAATFDGSLEEVIFTLGTIIVSELVKRLIFKNFSSDK